MGNYCKWFTTSATISILVPDDTQKSDGEPDFVTLAPPEGEILVENL